MEEKNDIFKVLFLIVAVVFLSSFVYQKAFAGSSKKVSFYGEQIRGSVGHLPELSGDFLVVKDSAKIISYRKSAPSFCIWRKSGSLGLICNYENGFIGYKLKPGKYWILPAVGKYSNKGKATVTVRCENCYTIKREK